MTEEEQARALAAWLEDPQGAPPAGVDAEVLEALGVLRPDLAPPHRVHADSITSHDATQGTVHPLREHRGWRQWMGGARGAGVLLAAGISGLVFLPHAPWNMEDASLAPPEDMFLKAPSVEEAVTPTADINTAPLPAREGSKTQDVAPPIEEVAVPPSVQSASPTTTVPSPPAPAAKPSLPNRAPSVGRSAPMAASPPPQRVADELGGTATMAGGSSGSFGAVRTQEPPAAPQQAMARAQDASPMSSRGRSKKERARMADPIEAPAMVAEATLEAADAPMANLGITTPDPLLTLRQDVLSRVGPFPKRTPTSSQEVVWLHEARDALDSGDPQTALSRCTQALALGEGPTPERRWLALLRGDAYRQLSRDGDAESSYREALNGTVR